MYPVFTLTSGGVDVPGVYSHVRWSWRTRCLLARQVELTYPVFTLTPGGADVPGIYSHARWSWCTRCLRSRQWSLGESGLCGRVPGLSSATNSLRFLIHSTSDRRSSKTVRYFENDWTIKRSVTRSQYLSLAELKKTVSQYVGPTELEKDRLRYHNTGDRRSSKTARNVENDETIGRSVTGSLYLIGGARKRYAMGSQYKWLTVGDGITVHVTNETTNGAWRSKPRGPGTWLPLRGPTVMPVTKPESLLPSMELIANPSHDTGPLRRSMEPLHNPSQASPGEWSGRFQFISHVRPVMCYILHSSQRPQLVAFDVIACFLPPPSLPPPLQPIELRPTPFPLDSLPECFRCGNTV